jgi:hypothetical protein
MTHATPIGTATQLSKYTHAVLTQMASVVQPHLDKADQTYAMHLGAHMRHIIEHYDTLANALAVSDVATTRPYVADYDARERNLAVETMPEVAMERIHKLMRVLTDLSTTTMERSVEVHTRGGLLGELDFKTGSSVARELMFLNSHATHHFAVLQAYAHQRGETLGAGVGKAPATVAHERKQLCETAQA